MSAEEIHEPDAEAFELPRFEDVEAAAARLAPVARRTPLITETPLDESVGGRVLIKPEVSQKTGSFKFRGAYNRLSQMTEAERVAGVVAFSSGNHGQGVAAAARLFNMPAVIVMPADAPRIKIDTTRALGAEIVLYDRASDDREDIARQIAGERGAIIVPSFDDRHIIAGQGTVGLEIAQQAEEAGLVPDAVLFCCGGGGLVSGSALALRERSPGTEVYAVEPQDFDETRRSLEAGVRLAIRPGSRSICDALLTPMPGRLTFALNRQLLTGALAVSDDEVRHAMSVAFRTLKLVTEPGGAVALAALLSGKIEARGRTIAVVISGGNVDPATFCECVG